jgi:hypothetical protein
VDVRGTVTLTTTGGGRWDQIQLNLTAAAQTYFASLRIGDPVCYQQLATALNTCDSDIKEVVLQAWVDNTVPSTIPGTAPAAVPGPGAPSYPPAVTPLAQDLNPMKATINPAVTSNGYASGSLCVLNQVAASPQTNAPAYPEWVLS